MWRVSVRLHKTIYFTLVSPHLKCYLKHLLINARNVRKIKVELTKVLEVWIYESFLPEIKTFTTSGNIGIIVCWRKRREKNFWVPTTLWNCFFSTNCSSFTSFFFSRKRLQVSTHCGIVTRLLHRFMQNSLLLSP